VHRYLWLLLFLLLTGCGSVPSRDDVAVAHAPVDAFFSCTEHFAGQFSSVGDALGTDCLVMRLVAANGRTWVRAYENDGAKNEDWYGWHEHLLSPCDCKVVAVYVNPQDNVPGVIGDARASSITFMRSDGVEFLFGHIRSPSVKPGDSVSSGQPVSMIGNNGMARNPHVHVGAWKGSKPLQIRWDQSTMRLPPEFRGNQ
jgi:hypothetical protein